MATCFRIPLLAALCAAACACQPGNDDTTAATGEAGAAATDATDTSGDTAMAGAFTCSDGSKLDLDWGNDQVVVKWPDGRSVTLPKAESASGPGGDAYVGDTVSIEHEGDSVVLRDGGKAALTCTADIGAASGSDAAITMRYACEPDTDVVVFADDSASVALPDGQQVTLSRVAGSAPPVFTGGSLYFSVGDDNAHLSQGDQTNELVCEPA